MEMLELFSGAWFAKSPAALLLLGLMSPSGFGPAFLSHLVATTYRQSAGRHILGDARARADKRTLSHADWSHEGGIAAHEYPLSNLRAVLVHAVVVAGNYPRPDVRALAYLCIAQVGEVAGLGSLAQLRLFGLNKVADVRIFADFAFRSQVRKRSDLCSVSDGALGQDATLPDEYVVTERAVFNHRIRPDEALCADPRFAQQLYKRLNYRIGRDHDVGIDNARLRLVDCHSGCHQPGCCLVAQLRILRHQSRFIRSGQHQTLFGVCLRH